MTTQNPPANSPKQISLGELFYVDGKAYIFTVPAVTTDKVTEHGHVIICSGRIS